MVVVVITNKTKIVINNTLNRTYVIKWYYNMYKNVFMLWNSAKNDYKLYNVFVFNYYVCVVNDFAL